MCACRCLYTHTQSTHDRTSSGPDAPPFPLAARACAVLVFMQLSHSLNSSFLRTRTFFCPGPRKEQNKELMIFPGSGLSHVLGSRSYLLLLWGIHSFIYLFLYLFFHLPLVFGPSLCARCWVGAEDIVEC